MYKPSILKWIAILIRFITTAKMKIPRKNNLKNNKFPISTNVYDTFSELSYDEKWSGAIGEPTSCPGFQKWTRHKTYKEKLLTINTTVIPNVTRLQ